MQTQTAVPNRNKRRQRVVIVGAGEAGVTLAIILHRLAERGLIPDSFSISLVDRAGEVLNGAGLAANVNHASGYEYLKPGHQQTGIDCIHGALTKRLFFDLTSIETGLENRFLMSSNSIECGVTTLRDFDANVVAMRAAYARAFDYVARGRGWTRTEAARLLGHGANGFGVRLAPGELAEHRHVVGGYRSAGGSVRMAYNFAVKKSLLERLQEQGIVTLFLGEQVRSIDRRNGQYRVTTTCHQLEADVVIVAAAHGTPHIAGLVSGGYPAPGGTYCLNGMLYVELRPTRDAEQLRLMSRVNFVLQGEGGCMYACCLPPSSAKPGYAAVYFPSSRGSQIDRHCYDPKAPAPTPCHWDDWIDHGLPEQLERERMERILRQLFRFHPVLEGHVSPRRFVVRTVFNPAVPVNPLGTDNRVRQLIGSLPLTEDCRVLTLTAPKWTNAELACLSAVDMILLRLWDMRLPRHSAGLGPQHFDVARLSRAIEFARVDVPDNMVADYQTKLGLPFLVQTEKLAALALSGGA